MNPAPASPPTSLTDYVRLLAALPAGQQPSDAAFLTVLPDLRNIVCAGLRGSGRWHLSPERLGYPEGATWERAFGRAQLPDIVVDFYRHLFGGHRRAYLQNLVAQGGVVEPFCAGRAVDQFLYDRHAETDSCGYAVYQNTRRSVHALVSSGVLTPSGTGLSGDTTVRFSGSGVAAAPADIETAVRNDHATWPPVLVQLGRIATAAQTALSVALRSFPGHGLTALTITNTSAGLAPPVRECSPDPESDNFSDIGAGDGDLLNTLAGAVPGDSAPAPESVIERLEQLQASVPLYQPRNGSKPQQRTLQAMRRLVAELLRLAEAGHEFVQAEVAERFELSTSTLNEHCGHVRNLCRQLWPEEFPHETPTAGGGRDAAQ